MRMLPAGPRGLLVECADQDQVLALHGELRRRLAAPGDWPWSRPVDIVAAARTVLIDGLDDPGALADAIPGWTPPPVSTSDGQLVTCPTVYDGPDLDAVAAHWGISRTAAIERHTATEFVVAFCGFAPGFAYLTGLEGEVPRLDTPRTRVPAGSVALGGEYGAIYPSPSPGGWRLIGRTELQLWNAERDPPALLTPGTRVHFEQVRR